MGHQNRGSGEPAPATPATPATPGSRVSPPLVFAAVVVVAVGLAMLFPEPALAAEGVRLLGLLPIALGSWLHLRAWRALRARETTVRADGSPRALVVDGPYARTRNPMYLSGIFILLGLALLLGAVAGLLAPLVYAAVAQLFFLPAEERVMEECFGDAYRSYRASIPTWV